MKKQIHGKRYDTDTATKVVSVRTIEDWERDLMLPPVYVQKLVIEKLETL